MKKQAWFAVKSIVVFAFLILLWDRVVAIAHLPAYILPGPAAVLAALRSRLPSLLNSLEITAMKPPVG